jgi:hypothetical protein
MTRSVHGVCVCVLGHGGVTCVVLHRMLTCNGRVKIWIPRELGAGLTESKVGVEVCMAPICMVEAASSG